MLCRVFYSLALVLACLTSMVASSQAQTAAPEASGPKQPALAGALDKAPPSELGKESIPAGSKVYIAPLNGYESFLVAAMVKKETPLVVVNSREKADYEITGVSESVQAGWAKMLFLGSQQSSEQASIVMTNIKSGVVVWGYNVNKINSYKGKQSSSEACAKHLKARIEGK